MHLSHYSSASVNMLYLGLILAIVLGLVIILLAKRKNRAVTPKHRDQPGFKILLSINLQKDEERFLSGLGLRSRSDGLIITSEDNKENVCSNIRYIAALQDPEFLRKFYTKNAGSYRYGMNYFDKMKSSILGELNGLHSNCRRKTEIGCDTDYELRSEYPMLIDTPKIHDSISTSNMNFSNGSIKNREKNSQYPNLTEFTNRWKSRVGRKKSHKEFLEETIIKNIEMCRSHGYVSTIENIMRYLLSLPQMFRNPDEAEAASSNNLMKMSEPLHRMELDVSQKFEFTYYKSSRERGAYTRIIVKNFTLNSYNSLSHITPISLTTIFLEVSINETSETDAGITLSLMNRHENIIIQPEQPVIPEIIIELEDELGTVISDDDNGSSDWMNASTDNSDSPVEFSDDTTITDGFLSEMNEALSDSLTMMDELEELQACSFMFNHEHSENCVATSSREFLDSFENLNYDIQDDDVIVPMSLISSNKPYYKSTEEKLEYLDGTVVLCGSHSDLDFCRSFHHYTIDVTRSISMLKQPSADPSHLSLTEVMRLTDTPCCDVRDSNLREEDFIWAQERSIHYDVSSISKLNPPYRFKSIERDLSCIDLTTLENPNVSAEYKFTSVGCKPKSYGAKWIYDQLSYRVVQSKFERIFENALRMRTNCRSNSVGCRLRYMQLNEGKSIPQYSHQIFDFANRIDAISECQDNNQIYREAFWPEYKISRRGHLAIIIRKSIGRNLFLPCFHESFYYWISRLSYYDRDSMIRYYFNPFGPRPLIIPAPSYYDYVNCITEDILRRMPAVDLHSDIGNRIKILNMKSYALCADPIRCRWFNGLRNQNIPVIFERDYLNANGAEDDATVSALIDLWYDESKKPCDMTIANSDRMSCHKMLSRMHNVESNDIQGIPSQTSEVHENEAFHYVAQMMSLIFRILLLALKGENNYLSKYSYVYKTCLNRVLIGVLKLGVEDRFILPKSVSNKELIHSIIQFNDTDAGLCNTLLNRVPHLERLEVFIRCYFSPRTKLWSDKYVSRAELWNL